MIIFDETENNSAVINITDFLEQMHKSDLKTSIFTKIENYFQFIEKNQIQSMETVSIIFSNPANIIKDVSKFLFN